MFYQYIIPYIILRQSPLFFRKTVVATLGPGSFFGEVGLIFGESRTADVRTKTYCEIAMLVKSDLDEVLETFPLIEHQFKSTSENKSSLMEIEMAAKAAEEDKAVSAFKFLIVCRVFYEIC